MSLKFNNLITISNKQKLDNNYIFNLANSYKAINKPLLTEISEKLSCSEGSCLSVFFSCTSTSDCFMLFSSASASLNSNRMSSLFNN